MEKVKNFLSILGLGITIGVILVVILVFVVGAIPKKVTVGGVEFEIPTVTIQAQPTSVSQQIEQPTVQSFAPAATEAPATQKSSPTNFPDITVSANASNGVQFTAPTSGNYTFTIKDGIYCTPSVCRSIIHGYLGRDIVWKDFYGLPHPMEQDYELGCWENPTASDKNCAVGMAATIYMNAQQYIRWIIMEDKNAFADNKGAVILSVTATP